MKSLGWYRVIIGKSDRFGDNCNFGNVQGIDNEDAWMNADIQFSSILNKQERATIRVERCE